MTGTPGGMRTLLLGLDAACTPIVDGMGAAGTIPTIDRLTTDGVAGPLTSGVPPWTPSAWPSLYTGTNPGKHGVFGFLDFDGYDWGVVNATHVRERPIWQYLDQYGLSSVVVNVPVTHPPRPFDGALVPGYTAPEDPTCHPAGLLEELRADVGDYRVYPEGTPDLDAYRTVVGQRGRAFRSLADRFDPDFGFLQFQVTDTVVHDRPGDEAALAAVYGAVDDEVRRVLEACDPDNVILASDHGIGEYHGRTFRVNEFLRRAGYVETQRGGVGMPSWGAVRETRAKAGAAAAAGTPDRSPAERLMSGLARLGVTSQRLERVCARLGVDDLARRMVPTGVISAGTEQVDFAASRAYMRSRIECGVRLNLEGREPDGIVPREAYGTVREELIDLLARARTPDGEPVFEDVAPREAYFDGRAADGAVDIVTVPADFEHFLSTGLGDEVFGPPEEPWNHKREGLVAATGPAIDPGAQPAGARIVDVAPTVLATFEVPAADRMDGTTLPFVEASGVRAYPAPGRRARRQTAGSAVERRLADLGYLDRDR